MKPFFIAAVTLAIVVCLAPWCESNQRASDTAEAAQEKNPRTAAQFNDGQQTETHDESRKNQSPIGDSPAQWILVIVTSITAAFICWQALETRRAAKSANRSIEAIMDKERARVEIIAGGVPLTPGQPVAIGVSLKNGGPTTAFMEGGRVRLLKTEREIEPDYVSGTDVPFTGTIAANSHTATQTAILLEPNPILTASQIVNINGHQSFIHFYGFIRYRDIYKRVFQVRIHLRWFVHTGLVIPSQITEYWEPAGKAEDNSDGEQKQPRNNWIDRLDEWMDDCLPN